MIIIQFEASLGYVVTITCGSSCLASALWLRVTSYTAWGEVVMYSACSFIWATFVFLSKPKNGSTIISLYKRVPNARITNPGISHATKGSSLSRHETIHMRIVLDVSTVDLYAADAYFVTAMPSELKNAISITVKTTKVTIKPD